MRRICPFAPTRSVGSSRSKAAAKLGARDTIERLPSSLAVSQAVIGHGDYTAKATEQVESSATAKVRKAKEIEALLKRGAHQLFTDEHDKLVEEFKSESIDQILSRSLTHRTEGEDVSTVRPQIAHPSRSLLPTLKSFCSRPEISLHVGFQKREQLALCDGQV